MTVTTGSLDMTEQPSTKQKPYKIVVGFDSSELAARAFDEALAAVAHRAPAEIHVLTVADPVGELVRLPGEADAMAEDLAREAVRGRIAKLVEDFQARRGSVSIERVAVYLSAALPVGNPAQLIVALANELDADLIVVGTHGRSGAARLLLGSVAEEVVRRAATSVLVVRPPDFVRGEKIPAIQPPLGPGEPHLRHFEHRRVYHYVDKVAPWTERKLPVS